MNWLSQLENFNIARKALIVNRAAQILLALSAMVALNILAAKVFKRVDLTEGGLYTLAPETLAYLRELRQPVEIIVTIPENAEEPRVHRDLKKLLREYTYAGRRDGGEPMIKVEFVDIYQQRRRASEIANRFGLSQENVILVASGERTREIPLADLYRVVDGKISAFRGEQAFTSAIVEISTRRVRTVYFLVGHGEMRIDDADPLRGLTQLEAHLRQRNIAVGTLDLARTTVIPDNADLIIVPSPQAAITPEAQELLRRYMRDNNGRMIVLIDPGRPTGLDDLFFDWGVLAEDMAVFDPGPDFRSASGDLLIRRMAEHPITHVLIEYQITLLMGQPRPVRIDIGALSDERLRVTQLIGTSEQSWADRDYRTERNPTFNPTRDLPGPIAIATVSERLGGAELGLNIPGGRLVVIGNSDFIANNRFDRFGNRTLMLNAINWSLDQTNLLNIPPRPFTSHQVILSQDNLTRLLFYFAILPLSVGLMGVVVFIMRRH
jgi:ABC-type uncharacterized transport system involved in gliding motility auxiliary subunit